MAEAPTAIDVDLDKTFRKADRRAQDRRDRAYMLALWAHNGEPAIVGALVAEAQLIEQFLSGDLPAPVFPPEGDDLP